MILCAKSSITRNCLELRLTDHTHVGCLFNNFEDSIHVLSVFQTPSPEAVKLEKRKEEYKKHWNQLLSSIKGSAIDPISIDCSLSINDILEKAISRMEGISHISHHRMQKCHYWNLMHYQVYLHTEHRSILFSKMMQRLMMTQF